MTKSIKYYRNRVKEKLLGRILKSMFPDGTRFSLATFERTAPTHAIEGMAGPETAFVFQGPVAPDFRETFATYRALFPQSPIIVSTWSDQRAALQDLREDAHTVFLFNDPPTQRGIMNVNLQIVSTARGVEAAALHFSGVTRVAKLRMDYPPRRPDAIFPLIDHFNRTLPGAARIWGVDINTLANLPFSFSDIFQIGPLSAMRRFWSLDTLDPRDITAKEFLQATANQTDRAEVLRLRPAEIQLTINYLTRLGVMPRPDSIEDYQRCLARYFGILDADQIGLAFDKYSPLRNGRHKSPLNDRVYVSMPAWLHLVATRGEV